MRERTPKVVVAFATTFDAMAMEAIARDHSIPGRTIPVPSEVSAGCGLAWCVDAHNRDALMVALERYTISYEGVFAVDMY